jgi:hypothetical protein
VHEYMCLYIFAYQGLVWLKTRRGFGLVARFIHFGDLQLLRATITTNTLVVVASQIPLMELHCADVSLRRLTAITDWRWWLTLIPEANWRRLLTAVYCLHYIRLGRPDRKHWPSYCWLLCNQHWPSYSRLPINQQYRGGGTYIWMYVCLSLCGYTYVYMCVCMYVRMYIYIRM